MASLGHTRIPAKGRIRATKSLTLGEALVSRRARGRLLKTSRKHFDSVGFLQVVGIRLARCRGRQDDVKWRYNGRDGRQDRADDGSDKVLIGKMVGMGVCR